MKRSSIALAVVLIALAAAPSAVAHAILQQSTPENGSVVRTSPAAVTLRFNEAVETAFGSIRIYDCGGGRVDAGKINRPNERSVAVAVGKKLPAGTYTVTWRVISADSHPVAGAFTFSVKTAKNAGQCKNVFGKGTPGSVAALFKFARALDFALVLLVVGGSIALALVLRSAADELRARLYRILAGLGVGLLIAGILCIVLQGAVAGGFGLSEAFHWNTVHSVLQTRFGKAFLYQLAFAAIVAILAFAAGSTRKASLGLLVLVPALFLLPPLSSAGHARTSGTLALLADIVHLAAASTWVGGLGFTILALLLAGDDRWPLASRAVPRFSLLAVISVVTLITAGIVRGSEELVPAGTALRHWPRVIWTGFVHTTYGQLLAKILLVLPLLGLGAYNNRYAVPRLRKQIASAVEQRRFLRAAGAELLIMATIVGVTAVLVTEAPAKALVKPPKLFSTTAPLGNLELNMTVEPARTGPNVIHIYTFTPRGLPASTAAMTLSATLPSKNLGPLRIPLQRIGPFHYTMSGATFPQPGNWQVTLEARRGEFEALTQTLTVPIRKG